MNDVDTGTEQRWLLLIHQLPSKPAYFRVKIWRRLQGLGAVAIKSTVYALPGGAEAQEDFEWLLREIAEGGGEAMLCEARLIDGLTDAEVRALFDAARDEDYDTLVNEAKALSARLGGAGTPDEKAEIQTQAGRLRKRLAEIARIDFFGASGWLLAEARLGELERSLAKDAGMAGQTATPSARALGDLKGRVWITRQGVHVDRMACSWLIRRFIDPNAVIRFAPGRGYVPEPGELRFDMFEGEITHEGDRCSFEVLMEKAGLDDPALRAVGEIVHDIDLKDAKFGREETAGIASLVAGICATTPEDEQRVAQGSPVFDTLYQYFRNKRS